MECCGVQCVHMSIFPRYWQLLLLSTLLQSIEEGAHFFTSFPKLIPSDFYFLNLMGEAISPLF